MKPERSSSMALAGGVATLAFLACLTAFYFGGYDMNSYWMWLGTIAISLATFFLAEPLIWLHDQRRFRREEERREREDEMIPWQREEAALDERIDQLATELDVKAKTDLRQ